MKYSVRPVKKVKTDSGIVHSTWSIVFGFLLGCDGVNDPTVTIYNGQSVVAGQEIVPTNTYDASALGLNGAVGLNIYCPDGVYVTMSCAGTVEVLTYFTPYDLQWVMY